MTSLHRIEDRAILRALCSLATQLCAAGDLRSIAAEVARAAQRVFPSRAVLVQVWDAESPNGMIEVDTGVEMSVQMHREPLAHDGIVVGEIVVDAHVVLDAAERATVEQLASCAAPAVSGLLRRRESEDAVRAAVQAVAALAEHRDHGSRRHLERIREYACIVAERLRERGDYEDQIDDGFLALLARAAPLHDVGKAGIPDAILLKPGRLSPGEWELMQTHAQLGADILDRVIADVPDAGFLVLAREIALCHHEKWDGSGYPNGLSGPEIPLAARIVAAVDVYDALTSERPYKPAWTHQDSIDWIRGCSGSHMDPRVVEALLDRADAMEAVRTRLVDSPEEHTVVAERAR